MIGSQKPSLKSSRMARRRRLVFILKIGIVFILCAIFLYFISWISYQPFWTIATIKVSDNSTINVASVDALVLQDLGGSYGLLFSKANLFMYPRAKVIHDIMTNFPQVSSVTLSVNNRTLLINLINRQAVYQWCPISNFASNFPDPSTALLTTGCDAIDSSGFIFMSEGTTTASSTSFFRFYGQPTASTTIESPIGTFYMGLQSARFVTLTEFISSLTNRGLPSYALVNRPDGVDELFLNQGGMIVFDARQDFTQVVTDVTALQTNTSIFSSGANLNYVDLRLGDKAFYRFGTIATSSTATSSTLTTSSILHTIATSTTGH